MDDKKLVYELITDCWGVAKKYGFEKMSDDDWMNLIDETHILEKKWKNISTIYYYLYRKIISALLDYVESHQKAMKGE